MRDWNTYSLNMLIMQRYRWSQTYAPHYVQCEEYTFIPPLQRWTDKCCCSGKVLPLSVNVKKNTDMFWINADDKAKWLKLWQFELLRGKSSIICNRRCFQREYEAPVNRVLVCKHSREGAEVSSLSVKSDTSTRATHTSVSICEYSVMYKLHQCDVCFVAMATDVWHSHIISGTPWLTLCTLAHRDTHTHTRHTQKVCMYCTYETILSPCQKQFSNFTFAGAYTEYVQDLKCMYMWSHKHTHKHTHSSVWFCLAVSASSLNLRIIAIFLIWLTETFICMCREETDRHWLFLHGCHEF